MFCFAEDNKIISGLKNYNCGTGLKKKKGFSTHLVIKGCGPYDNVLSPSHYIYVLKYKVYVYET
jgi:hypothetical protein